MLSPEYVAGLFDGEGTVSIIYSKVRPWKKDPNKHVLGFKMIVGLCNTYHPIIDALQKQFGGDVSIASHSDKAKNHKPVKAWKITGNDLKRKFLETIKPHCVIKAKQVELGLRFLETAVGRGQRISPDQWNDRIKIFWELRGLNQRGLGKPPKHIIPENPTEGWNPSKRGYSNSELAEMMSHVRSSK